MVEEKTVAETADPRQTYFTARDHFSVKVEPNDIELFIRAALKVAALLGQLGLGILYQLSEKVRSLHDLKGTHQAG